MAPELEKFDTDLGAGKGYKYSEGGSSSYFYPGSKFSSVNRVAALDARIQKASEAIKVPIEEIQARLDAGEVVSW